MELYSEATDSESDAVVVTDAIIFVRINSLIEKLDQVISSTQEMSQNLTRTNLNSDTENVEGETSHYNFTLGAIQII